MSKIIDKGTDRERVILSDVAVYDYDDGAQSGSAGWCRDRGDAEGRQPVVTGDVLTACGADGEAYAYVLAKGGHEETCDGYNCRAVARVFRPVPGREYITRLCAMHAADPRLASAARLCAPQSPSALVAHLSALPPAARDAFLGAVEAGAGWDSAAISASLAAPGCRVASPFGERVSGELVEVTS